MRILMIEPGPAFSVADVHRGWVKAFGQLGCQVENFNLSDRLDFYSAAHLRKGDEFVQAFSPAEAATIASKGIEAAALEMWPDVVMFTSGFYVPPSLYALLRARGMTVVLNYLEAPYEDLAQVAAAGHVDMMLINDPTNLDLFRAVNTNTHYMPAAYDPDIHRPGPIRPEAASDFCFVGTGFPSRIKFLEAVDWDGIDVALAGNWLHLGDDSPLRKFVAHDIANCCDNTETVDLYRACKASANLYRREGVGPNSPAGGASWAMGPREVELAAIGTFYLRDPRGEGDEILPMLPTFDGPEDFADKLRWYLTRDDLRRNLAGQARAAVSERTFISNARELLRLHELKGT
jgi:spore maturation protein CgeB